MMSNLAENIHKFEIKRRIVKRQIAGKQHTRTKSTDRPRNHKTEEKSSFRLMINDYRKRLHHYVSSDRTMLNEQRLELEVEKNEHYFNLPLKVRKSAELKNIEVKFGVNNRG
jgi:hypothetical protein